jgi:predicted nucleic acid-binding protein
MQELEMLKRESDERLQKLLTSISILEESLGLYKKGLDKAMERVVEKIDPEDWRYYHAEIYAQYDEVETDLPSVLRSSIFVHVYSVLENILNELCLIHKNKKQLGLSLSDLRHEGIARAKIYLTKVSGSSCNEASKEWGEIVKINRIRNVLVHNAGLLVKGKHPNFEEIKQYIESASGLTLSSAGKISVGPEYVPRVIEIFTQYLLDLFEINRAEFAII